MRLVTMNLDMKTIRLRLVEENDAEFILSLRLDEKYNKFGWDELENYNYFIRNDYKYCGIINIRKNKLNKLNDICKSTI